MVASVANPSLTSAQAALGRPARADSDDTSSARVGTALRREIAVTAKFGPDPETGSPLRIITGDDVEAAETNDLQRLSEVNLGLSSPETSFQVQSIRSAEEFAQESGAAQQTLSASQTSFSRFGGSDSDGGTERGSTVDFEI